ncbi:MAG: ABC transporter permease [Bacillati bacterium ANGP1]|uniref:ABC transporter permease n=1 Tax=Candidatus Segetimicrobium genomatis TaxID=2569760 RepID=A0A537JDS9_9BACT|nr:MAG: ABC transporter permease [Terrabacteria group bacterium ANGP1]
MLAFVVRRLAALVPVLFVVAVFVFSLIHITPGDPAAYMLGPSASPAEVEHLRGVLGLNLPLYQQFVIWLGHALRGDLGQSIFMGIPVSVSIAQRLEPTFLLTLLAVIFMVAIGIPAGTLAATRRNTLADQAVMALAVLGLSVPSFWLGLNLILLVGVKLRWLPVAGYVPLAQGGVWAAVRTLLMPAVSLGFINAALIARITRSSMLDVLGLDFVRTARAKGLPRAAVIWRHALANAILPVLTAVGNTFTVLLGGLVVTEQVFAIPGVGQLVINAVLRRDYPVIQGAVLYVVTLYIVINIGLDVLYAAADPRIKYS